MWKNNLEKKWVSSKSFPVVPCADMLYANDLILSGQFGGSKGISFFLIELKSYLIKSCVQSMMNHFLHFVWN